MLSPLGPSQPVEALGVMVLWFTRTRGGLDRGGSQAWDPCGPQKLWWGQGPGRGPTRAEEALVRWSSGLPP